MQFNKYGHTHKYHRLDMYNRTDCAVMCNFINTYTHKDDPLPELPLICLLGIHLLAVFLLISLTKSRHERVLNRIGVHELLTSPVRPAVPPMQGLEGLARAVAAVDVAETV